MNKTLIISLALFACVSAVATHAQSSSFDYKSPSDQQTVVTSQEQSKPVSVCWHQEQSKPRQHYACPADRIVVIRPSGEVSCRPVDALAEEGEKFCTAQK